MRKTDEAATLFRNNSAIFHVSSMRLFCVCVCVKPQGFWRFSVSLSLFRHHQVVKAEWRQCLVFLHP